MSKKSSSDNQQTQHQKDDCIELVGTVEDAMAGTMFKVICEHGNQVLATLSGKLRQNKIRVLAGDTVKVEVSVYDTTRGRIVWRA